MSDDPTDVAYWAEYYRRHPEETDPGPVPPDPISAPPRRMTTAKQRAEIAAAPYHYGRHFDDGHVEDEQQIYDRDGKPIFGVGPQFNPNVGGDEDADEQEIPEPDEGTIVVTASPNDPVQVAKQLVAELMTHADGTLITRWWRGDYYTWTGTHWQEQSTAKLRSVLYRVMSHAHYRLGLFELVPWQPTRRKIGDLIEALQALVHLEERTEPPAWVRGGDRGSVIAVANGGLRVDDRSLSEHTPRYFNLTSLPYEYDKDASEPKRWLRFLDELFPNDPDSTCLLQEWAGYVVGGHTDQHKIMLLVGPPRAGKGTIARVLAAIVGKDAVASPTLSSLSRNFGLQPLIGKSLALVGDVRLGADTYTVTERLLSISGEDYQTVDRKYKSAWFGRLGVRFMLVSNELPRLGDASGALASRFAVLQLTRSWLGQEDHDLQAKLEAELGGILNWCLAGLDRLNQQGRFTVPTASDEAIQTLEDLSSPIRAFVREYCELGPAHSVFVDEIYPRWQEWCTSEGMKRIASRAMFGRDLLAAFPSIRSTRPRAGDEKRRRGYRGIALRETNNRPGPRPTTAHADHDNEMGRDGPRPNPYVAPTFDSENGDTE